MTKIQLELQQEQINHVNAMLQQFPDQIPVVFRGAIDRGLIAGRTQATKEIRKRYAIKTGNLNKYSNVRITPAGSSGSDTIGAITFAGQKIPLYRFNPRPQTRQYTNRFVNGHSGWRVTRDVSAEDVKGSMKRLPAGFITTFRSGHTGLFRRNGKATNTGKAAIQEYWGFSMADMLDYPETRESVEERMQEMMAKRLDQNLYYVLRRM